MASDCDWAAEEAVGIAGSGLIDDISASAFSGLVRRVAAALRSARRKALEDAAEFRCPTCEWVPRSKAAWRAKYNCLDFECAACEEFVRALATKDDAGEVPR